MKKRKTLIITVLVVSLVAFVGVMAVAQPNAPSGNRQPGGNNPQTGRPPGGGMLQRLDTDGDGKVSKEEFVAEFDRLDQDKSGYIEEDEFPQGPPQGGPQGNRPSQNSGQGQRPGGGQNR